MSIFTFGVHIPDGEASEAWLTCVSELQRAPKVDELKEHAEEMFFYCHDGTLQVFAVTSDRNAFEAKVMQLLQRRFSLPADVIAKYRYRLDDADAIKAFFKVSIGMHHLQDTDISIEHFRASFDLARSHGFIGPKIHKLYQRGLWLAEKVRMEMNLQKHVLSPESVVVELAQKIFGDLHDHRALVAVNHYACRKFIEKLQVNNIGELLLWQPPDAHNGIWDEFAGQRIGDQKVLKMLPSADLLLVFNDRFSDLLKTVQFSRVMSQRKNAPLLYVSYLEDSRALSQQLAGIYNLYFYCKEDLQKVVYNNLKAEEKSFFVIDQLFDREIDDFMQWLETNEYYRFGNIIGKSDAMQKTLELIARIAQTDITVLIDGDSGTGKELIAKSIHEHSNRKDKPFVVVNCGAIPENLLESELFGHVRGAFTGATANKKGLFETADGGTIFLDEIGELPLSMQVKLLRFLQEGEIKPVGGTATVKLNVRMIAATNRNLETMVEEGLFRQDLYYRLNVIQMTLPPLRDRREDILPLAEFFVKKYSEKFQKSLYGIDEEAQAALMNYCWRGNVRELENVIERAVALAPGHKITVPDLPDNILTTNSAFQEAPSQTEPVSLKELEKQHIERTLVANDWNYDLVAKILGIGRTTLWRKMKEYQISNKKAVAQ